MKRVVSRLVFSLALLATPIAAHGQSQSLVLRVTTLEGQVSTLTEQVSTLTQRVAAQRNRIAALQAALQPQFIFVNCGAGQSINSALAGAVGQSAPLTIRIAGMCTEAVVIGRDDVILEGLNPGDGVQAPSPDANPVLASGQRVAVRNLTIQGGLGLGAISGGAVSADNILVTGAVTGLNVTFDAHLNVRNSVIENGRTGALVGRGAMLSVGNTTFRNHTADGVSVITGRAIFQPGVLIEGSNLGAGIRASLGSIVSLVGTTIRNHDFGVVVAGSHLGAGGTIEGNRFGLYAVGGSSISFGGTIRGNQAFGVRLADVSVFVGSPSTVITSNGDWGVLCAPAPAVPQISEGIPYGGFSVNGANVFGNAAGQINCPGIVVP